MRKAQKKMALEFIQTLYQAHDQIRSMINRKETSGAMNLLEQCQDGAIQLGGLIEQEEGEGFITVDLLEVYCEIIYQIYEDIGTNENENGDKAFRSLRKQLVQIENSVKNDIKQKIEAVFLPYNASMWDSLESVWKAAAEDENCDAYVIPIPYYDKNPDGSFKEEHWEGDRYPDYVPITKYDAYDFAERHPDMIFIHNPYDNCNLVTSVHPFFYSKNLKKFTDKLIYIPYFVLDEIAPDNQQAVEKMQHFCTVPGVLNADNTIVQSEDMRRIYINVITKLLGENTKNHWENKILGIGSPKLDKVLNTKREDLKIPEEWLNVIRKSDGSWRKVVFYNTSIGTLLQYNEKMLEKMKNVFKIFKENQDNVALLWRPHPLFRATIESMRPQLWKEYQELTEWYRESGWGIYDDSSEVERAIALSDAYYGDNSSLVAMYKKTYKYVLIQNVSTSMAEPYSYGGLEAAVLIDHYIWGAASEFNALMKIDVETNRMELVEHFPEEDIFSTRLFGDAVHMDGKLIFVPMSASNIAIYEIADRRFTLIPIDERIVNDSKFYKRKYKFCKAVVQDRNIYIISCSFPAIIRLNMDDYQLTYITEWVGVLNRHISDWSEVYFRSVCVSKEKEIWMPSCSCNMVVKFSLIDASFQYYEVGGQEGHYSDIEYDGKLFWLSSKNGHELIAWDPETGSITHTVECMKEITSSRMFIENTALYVIPWNDSNLWKINTITGRLEAKINMGDAFGGFIGSMKHDEQITLFTHEGDIIEIDDLKKCRWKEHHIIYSDEIVRRELCRRSLMLGLIENRRTRLCDLLQIISKEYVSVKEEHENCGSGHKIFEVVSRI